MEGFMIVVQYLMWVLCTWKRYPFIFANSLIGGPKAKLVGLVTKLSLKLRASLNAHRTSIRY